ncbi:MAG TPA: hypothetical protein VLA43_08380 [Longimicrobiales bacterium]|nr:hypothetical protein [Longimicrobiales bacterium]
MTLSAPLFPQGTRVVVRQGRLPMNAGVVGRTGTVVATDDYRPRRYGVLLDGDASPRDFTQDELRRAGS